MAAIGGEGAAVAVKQAGKAGKIKIVAMDRNEATLQFIEEGVIDASIAQRTYLMPYLAMQMLYDLRNDRIHFTKDWKKLGVNPLPINVDTGTFRDHQGQCGPVPPQSVILMDSALLEMRLIRKRFGEVLVLHCVNLDVRGGSPCPGGRKRRRQKHADADCRRYPCPGRRHYGLRRPAVRAWSPADALRAGIAMVHQELSLAPDLTVAENILAGLEPLRWGCFVDRKKLFARAAAMLAEFCPAVDPHADVASLGMGYRQVVEILKSPRLEPEDHHLRRTDFRAGGPGNRVGTGNHPQAEGQIGGHRLHLPSPRRSLPHQRSDYGAPRRHASGRMEDGGSLAADRAPRHGRP